MARKKMSALETVKDAYKRFAEGDMDGFLSLCSENIEWVCNGPAALEKCKSFKGHRGVQDFMEILGTGWEFSTFTPREFIASNDKVVVLGEETGTNRKSNIKFENRWSHVFDVQDGYIVRYREFLCHWTGDQNPPAMSWTIA